MSTATPTASELLAVAAKTLGERGADYDPTKAAGERSMPAVVPIFKELSGKELTEQEGWLFMVAMKLARIKTSPAKLDSHVDLIAYVSLYSESVLASHEPNFKDSGNAPHPNRQEIEKGIAQGRSWRWRDKSKGQDRGQWSKWFDSSHKPMWLISIEYELAPIEPS